VKVFTCFNIMLSITVFLLISSVSIKVMTLLVWREIFIPNVCTVWCKARNSLYKLPYEFAMITWSSANNMVFNPVKPNGNYMYQPH
jgi:hypothetical protein